MYKVREEKIVINLSFNSWADTCIAVCDVKKHTHKIANVRIRNEFT
jgi:hypothetical protein